MLMMPLIALGAGAAIIPIVVHMMHRQKTTPIQWGAMQFLLDAPLKQKRREHIDHWLLMLCRMGLLALLAFMLARPLILDSRYNPFATNTATDIAVVVDHSLSMSRRSGNQTLFEQAISQVQKISGMMRPADSLSIVLAEHTPRHLADRPVTGGNIPALIDALAHENKPNTGLTDASIPDAVQAARDLVNHGGNIRKQIFVISDEQRTGWLIDNQTAWRNALGDRLMGLDRAIEVYNLPVTIAAGAPNVSVSGINLLPAFLGVGRPVAITASVANSGPGDMPAIPLNLIVDGRTVAAQQISNLGANQSRTIRFDYTFTDAGSHWVKIQADVVDPLDADNSCIAAVEVSLKLPVLIIDGQLSGSGFAGAAFLQAAMQPGDSAGSAFVVPRVVSVSDAAGLAFNDYRVVILNDVSRLPPQLVARLTEFALTGHGVWFILGPRADQSFFNGTLSKTVLFPNTLKQRRMPATPSLPATIDIKDPDSPMIALLNAAEHNAFTGVTLDQWWALDAANSGQRVVLATSTGDPLVLDHLAGSQGGHVVIWTTTADGQWNNLPLVTNFLPLVHETLYQLASGQTMGLNRRMESGGDIVWTGPAQPAVESAQITQPDTTVHRADPLLGNDGKWLIRYTDTYQPGLYELGFAPPEIPQPVYYSVNINQKELDPATLAAADLAWLKDNSYVKERITSDGLAAALGAQNRGTELWPYLALGVIGMLVLETFLTRRILRLQVDGKIAGAKLAAAGERR
jgi:hypothetical protein